MSLNFDRRSRSTSSLRRQPSARSSMLKKGQKQCFLGPRVLAPSVLPCLRGEKVRRKNGIKSKERRNRKRESRKGRKARSTWLISGRMLAEKPAMNSGTKMLATTQSRRPTMTLNCSNNRMSTMKTHFTIIVRNSAVVIVTSVKPSSAMS